MNISKKLETLLNKFSSPDYAAIKTAVSFELRLDAIDTLEAVRGVYSILWGEDYSEPESYRHQLEHILGEGLLGCWFEMDATQRLELYVTVCHLEAQGAATDYAVHNLMDDIYFRDLDEAIGDFNEWYS